MMRAEGSGEWDTVPAFKELLDLQLWSLMLLYGR